MQPGWAAHIVSNNIRDPSSEIPTNVPMQGSVETNAFLTHFAACRNIPNWSIIEASCNTSVLYPPNAPLGKSLGPEWLCWALNAKGLGSFDGVSDIEPIPIAWARRNANMKLHVKKSTRMNTIRLSACTKVLEGRTRAGNAEQQIVNGEPSYQKCYQINSNHLLIKSLANGEM